MSSHNHWLRLWHEMPSDPKFRTVAKSSKRPISEVIAIYIHYLVDASKNSRRGFKSISNEDVASALDLEIEDVDAVESAMQGRLLDGDRLKGWESRQPLREETDDATPASERMRRMRNRKKAEQPQAPQLPLLNESDKDDEEPQKTAFEIENPPLRELLKDDPHYTQPADKSKSTPSGRICEAIRAEGISQCNSSNPKLIALIEAGATVEEFVDAARQSIKVGKPHFNYVVGTVHRRREEVLTMNIHTGPLPTQTSDGRTINPTDIRIFGEAAKSFKAPVIAEDGSIQ